MKVIFLAAMLTGCFPHMRQPEPVVENEPEKLNNVITKELWDFCCRICMKDKRSIEITYNPDSDTLNCKCADGNSADINIKE